MHMTATGSGTSSQGADEKGPHRVAPGGAPAFAPLQGPIWSLNLSW